jgi:hypothetical protein
LHVEYCSLPFAICRLPFAICHLPYANEKHALGTVAARQNCWAALSCSAGRLAKPKNKHAPRNWHLLNF